MWDRAERNEVLTDHDCLDEEFQIQSRVANELPGQSNAREYDTSQAYMDTEDHLANRPKEDALPISLLSDKKQKSEDIEVLESILYPSGEDSYIPWSVMNTLFCGVVIGLIALVCSLKSSSFKSNEKKGLAKRYSRLAYFLNILATFTGCSLYLTLYLVYCWSDLLDSGTPAKHLSLFSGSQSRRMSN